MGAAVQIEYLRPHGQRTRVIDLCLLTDFEYRHATPGWEASIEPLFRVVNPMFRRAGVQWRVTVGGDAYAPGTQGNMGQRTALAAGNATRRADVLLIITGRGEKDVDSVALPFAHAAMVQHQAGETEAMKATVVARALGNLFGVPGGTRALIVTGAPAGEVFDGAAVRLIKRLRDYPFSEGPLALPGQWEGRALEALTEAVAGRTPHPESAAHRTLARAFAGGLRYDDAVRHLREAVRTDPANIDLRFELAMEMNAASDAQAALAELQAVTRAEPENALPHAAMGAIYLNSGRTEEAADQFRAAVGIEPRNASYLTALGVALLRQPGRIREAAAAFDGAVQLRPAEPGAYSGLMLQREAQKVYGELVQQAEAEARNNPQSADANIRLALAYGFAGSLDAAQSSIQRALALQPSNGSAHLILARLHYLNGRYAAAQEELDAARARGVDGRMELVNAIRRKLGP